MDKDELERVAAMAIDMEMALFLERNHLEEQGQSEGNIDEQAASLASMQVMSEAIQENVQIRRNEKLQTTLLNSLEIVGLPDDICENCEDVADVLTQITREHLKEDSIRGFETVDEFTGAALGQEGPTNVQSRTLVVHLANRNTRNYIISMAQHTPLNFPHSGRVFIYEHLTHMNRMIFQKAKQAAFLLNYEFVWVQDGKIYARKNRLSAARQIRNDVDIEEMAHY